MAFINIKKFCIFCSAVLAGLLDTMSLVYRQKQNCARLSDVTSGLAQATRNFAAVQTAFPVDVAGTVMYCTVL